MKAPYTKINLRAISRCCGQLRHTGANSSLDCYLVLKFGRFHSDLRDTQRNIVCGVLRCLTLQSEIALLVYIEQCLTWAHLKNVNKKVKFSYFFKIFCCRSSKLGTQLNQCSGSAGKWIDIRHLRWTPRLVGRGQGKRRRSCPLFPQYRGFSTMSNAYILPCVLALIPYSAICFAVAVGLMCCFSLHLVMKSRSEAIANATKSC